MNAPSMRVTMEMNNSRIYYFLIIIQILVILISGYKLINSPNEKQWILAIVLSTLIFIFIFSIIKNNKLEKYNSSLITHAQSNNNSKISKNEKSSEMPEILDENWNLPI